MEKYECTVCGYVYEPNIGNVTNGIDYGTALKNCPTTGNALYAVQANINLIYMTTAIQVFSRI